MTAQEHNDNRITAWEIYLASKKKYSASKEHLQKWGKLLNGIGTKLVDDTANVIEQDYAWMPTHPKLTEGIDNFQIALREFRNACAAAVAAGFPVDANDRKEVGL